MHVAARDAPWIILVHSPLVGPFTWQRVADQLLAHGRNVNIPSLVGMFDEGPPYYSHLAAAIPGAVADAWPNKPVTLVGHSGAGALLPAISQQLGGRVQAAISWMRSCLIPGRVGSMLHRS